jgi:hypothetical protein
LEVLLVNASGIAEKLISDFSILRQVPHGIFNARRRNGKQAATGDIVSPAVFSLEWLSACEILGSGDIVI